MAGSAKANGQILSETRPHGHKDAAWPDEAILRTATQHILLQGLSGIVELALPRRPWPRRRGRPGVRRTGPDHAQQVARLGPRRVQRDDLEQGGLGFGQPVLSKQGLAKGLMQGRRAG